MEEKAAGLLLQTTPYLGQKKILKIFTPHGMATLFAQKCTLTPFCIAEWVWSNTQKEIGTLKDTTLLDPLLCLKESYPLILAAGQLAKDLLRTQLPGKGAPEVYQLACLYFKKLPLAPTAFVASFKLKLLLHEGLLSLEQDPLFSSSEWETVLALTYARTISHIVGQSKIPEALISALFDERLTR